MAGNIPAAAIQHFVDAFREALHCVTNAPVTVNRYDPGGQSPLNITVNRGQPISLSGPKRLDLSVAYRYEIVRHADGSWLVQPTGYMYDFDGEDGRELISFHWHPLALSLETLPHLHLGIGTGVLHPNLTRKAHIPTGTCISPRCCG